MTQRVSANHIVRVILAKLAIATVFLLYLSEKDLSRLPLMVDQERYLFDIAAIQNDVGVLFSSDEVFSTPRTLYARFVGGIAWLVPFEQQPITIAVYLNSLLTVAIAAQTVRIFAWFGGRNTDLLFYIIALSPTLTIYSFFAIRDVFIVLIVVVFLANFIERRYFRAAIAAVACLFLRPFQSLLFLFWVALFCVRWAVNRSNQKRFSVAVLTMFTFVSVAAVGVVFGPPAVANYAAGGVEWVRLATNALGLEALTGAETGVRVSSRANMAARIVMFDSVAIPILSALVFVRSAVDVARARSHPTDSVVFVAVLSFLSAVLISYSYIAIQDGLAFRKILPLLPVMWIAVALYSERRRDRLSTSERSDGKGQLVHA